MTRGLREGRRGASARADTVLVRAARRAGTSDEIVATDRAITAMMMTVEALIAGAPGAPSRPVPVLVSRGAIIHPATRSAAAARAASMTCSTRSTIATVIGVAPTALRRLTLLDCSV